MPFAKGARIEIENQTDVNIGAFYYYIDYVEMKELPKDMGRFHAWFNREITEALPEGETEWGSVGKQTENKDGADNYVFADIKGKGHFVGLNYYVQCPTPCGMVKAMTCGSSTVKTVFLDRNRYGRFVQHRLVPERALPAYLLRLSTCE